MYTKVELKFLFNKYEKISKIALENKQKIVYDKTFKKYSAFIE